MHFAHLISTVYPSGTLSYGYGTSSSFNDALSRIGALYIQNAAYPTPTETSNYQYSGVSRVMETRHESLVSEVALTRYIPATPGDYVNLDRFGRVKSQIWKTSSSLRDQQDYDHDLAGNRIQRDLPATLTTTHGQLYTYDGLNRLADYKQGTIATGVIASPTKDATWELDGLGNWANYVEKASGTTTLDQDRTHNPVNEITDFTNTTGSAWSDPTHDAAGNLTLAPSPVAPTNSAKDQTYIWDAWNRLVEVKEGGTTLAKFGYDGLNRRITKLVGSDTYHYYLSEENQVLEEKKQLGVGTPTSQQEFVWQPRYTDALAVRYDNTTLSEVAYYATYDANYNITGMINSSGAVQERYSYTPYGEVTVVDANFANPANSSSINQDNLYTGRQRDPETGLFYYRARYYNTSIGRFANRDPLEYDGNDINLYRYVQNNPVNFVDPAGTVTQKELEGIIKEIEGCKEGKALIDDVNSQLKKDKSIPENEVEIKFSGPNDEPNSCNSKRGKIYIDKNDDRCTTFETLIVELSNLQQRDIFIKLAENPCSMTRAKYIEAYERTEYDSVKNTLDIFDKCGKQWNCPKAPTYDKRRGDIKAGFQTYFANLSIRHKEFYGQLWDNQCGP